MSPLLPKRAKRGAGGNPHALRLHSLGDRPFELTTDAWERSPRFGFERLADAIARVILDSEPQLTLAVYGQWGSGKTTLLRAVHERIESDDCAVAWFDTWEYQAEEHVVAHLLHAMASALPQDSEAARGLRRLARAALATASFKAGVVSVSGKDLLAELDRMLEAPKLESSQLKAKVDLWRGKSESRRIVVIVDNLDRCLPKLAVQILDQITSLFGFSGVVFLIAADKERLERAVQYHHELTEEGEGARYLEKIVQVDFRLPSFAKAHVKNWIHELARPSLVLEDVEVALLAETAGWNPRQIKRLLNNVRIVLCVLPERQPADDRVALVSALLLHTAPQEWLALTGSEPRRQERSEGLADKRPRTLVDDILSSAGGQQLLALDDEAMSRFLTAAETGVSVAGEAGEEVFERARAKRAQTIHLYLDASGWRVYGLVGALSVLEEQEFTFARVGGASAGAAIAALLVAGYTPAQLRELLHEARFERFGSDDHRPRGLRQASGPIPTEHIRAWMRECLERRRVRSFADLAEGRLRILVTDPGRSDAPVFLPDGAPELGVADAVAASMSWPHVFHPFPWSGGAFIDGHRSGHYPIGIFDDAEPKAPTFGVRVVEPDAARDERTIDVPYDGEKPAWAENTTDGDIDALYQAGREAARRFL
jgi:predicted acylesterase/phospholipase RssA/energy-coupling factor transporter ATP-binding protein EcfA2